MHVLSLIVRPIPRTICWFRVNAIGSRTWNWGREWCTSKKVVHLWTCNQSKYDINDKSQYIWKVVPYYLFPSSCSFHSKDKQHWKQIMKRNTWIGFPLLYVLFDNNVIIREKNMESHKLLWEVIIVHDLKTKSI